jgi:hypothetical protein
MIRLPTLPKPVNDFPGLEIQYYGPAYTADQMRAYATAASIAALEEAALMLCNMGYKGFGMDAFTCAQAIYDLKNAPA